MYLYICITYIHVFEHMYQLESHHVISTDTDTSFQQINANHTYCQIEIVRLCTEAA